MIEELRGSLLKLLSSYNNNAKNIGKKVADPLAPVETEETLRARLKPLIQEKFKQFSNELTARLEEINASYQFMSSILPEYEKLQSLTESITYLNEILDQVNGLTVDGDALDEFCKNFGNKDKSGKSIVMEKLFEKINPEKIESIQPNLAAVQQNFFVEAGKDVIGQREKLTQKINEIETKLKVLDSLAFIPEVKDFIEKTTLLLEPARNCSYSGIPTQMQQLNGINFAKFDKAITKFNEEKKAFDDKKLGDLKKTLEKLKKDTATLAPLIDPILDKFKTIESPMEMDLETFEKDETSLISPIETAITDFITQQANLMNDLLPFHYAIEPSKLAGLNQLTTELNSITELTPDKLEKAFSIQQVAAEIRTDLKAKKLLADDDKSHRLDTPNDKLVGELGAISQDIMAEKATPRNISDQTSEQSLQDRLESLRQRCVSLQGKDGHIDAHQREIALQRSLLIREKNAEILNEPSFAATALAEDIKIARKRHADATTGTFGHEKYRTAQQKEAESLVFKQKDHTRRAALLGNRTDILKKYAAAAITHDEALASVNSIQVNTAKFLKWNVKWNWLIKLEQNDKVRKQHTQFQADLKNVLNQLKAIDKQLLGKQRANAIYTPIFDNIPHLIGGTQIMIPQHLIDLQTQLEEAHNTFKR